MKSFLKLFAVVVLATSMCTRPNVSDELKNLDLNPIRQVNLVLQAVTGVTSFVGGTSIIGGGILKFFGYATGETETIYQAGFPLWWTGFWASITSSSATNLLSGAVYGDASALGTGISLAAAVYGANRTSFHINRLLTMYNAAR